MANLEATQIHTFFKEVGQRYTAPATLYLLGGSALCLLGSTRPTQDIDYVGDDIKKNSLQQTIEQVATDLHILVEAVPIEQFIPLPPDAQERRILVGRFGALEVYIVDPYVIALSKIDRGFDTDIEDIIFLVQRNLVTFAQLETVVTASLERWQEFTLNPVSMRTNLQVLQAKLAV